MKASGAHLVVLDGLVQMRLMELRRGPTPDTAALSDMTCRVKDCTCTTAADIIASHADAWMYAPRSPEGRAGGRALVEGIAVAAMVQPAGVDLWDLHWCGEASCGSRHERR